MNAHRRLISCVSGFASTILLFLPLACPGQALVATSTVLAISPSGSVGVGNVVTLTASVTSGGTAVSPGLVVFCNALAAPCNDLAVLGQAQLTGAGVATLRLRLGIGSHSIKAVFQGTPHGVTPAEGSTSPTEVLTVTGTPATTATIAGSGVEGDFSFTGTINAYGRFVPHGNLSFLDTNHGDLSIGSPSLDWGTAPFGFILSTPSTTVVPFYADAVDLNNDGKPDLVTLNRSGGVAMSVLLGNGDGAFVTEPSLPLLPTDQIVNFTTADFNSDGIPDLAVDVYDYRIKILLGNGDGTFSYKSNTDWSLGQPVVADFNGDGIPDLAAENTFSDQGTVEIMLGNGDGTFTALYPLTPDGMVPEQLLVADFNGDGIPDLASMDEYLGLSILLGNGDGTFAAPLPSGCACGGWMGVGDFNGDGKADIAVVTDTYYGFKLSILIGNGNGTFTILPSTYTATNGTFVVGDFNGDGIEDLAFDGTSPEVRVGKGDGTFPTVVPISGAYGPSESIAAADFNGDGVTDLVSADGYEPWAILLLGGFTATASINGVSFTGEGEHDVVSSYSGDTNYSPSQSSPIAINNVTAPPTLSPPPAIYKFTQSVALSDSTPGSVIYYTLDGKTPTAASPRYTTPIVVSWQTTINAIAISPALGTSAAAGGTYFIDRLLQPPIFSLPSGTYGEPLTFRLTPDPTYCSPGACQIYYTIDGQGFKEYTGPVTITKFGTTPVKAITTEWHYSTSNPANVVYEVK
jgi:hypothetical protein